MSRRKHPLPPVRERAKPVVTSGSSPCAQCPWRTSNHGKRHPDGWYTKANRQRLWAGLRRGDPMTCHPTDPENPVPLGTRAVPETVQTKECAGAIILQQREVWYWQHLFKGDFQVYRKARPFGLTRDGLAAMVSRLIFGGVPVVGGPAISRPNLNEPVSHPPLGVWEEQSHDRQRSG